MTDRPGEPGAGFPPLKDTSKRRRCLRCAANFLSAWAGERVCARCKSTKSWRSGAPSNSPLFNGRR